MCCWIDTSVRCTLCCALYGVLYWAVRCIVPGLEWRTVRCALLYSALFWSTLAPWCTLLYCTVIHYTYCAVLHMEPPVVGGVARQPASPASQPVAACVLGPSPAADDHGGKRTMRRARERGG